MLQSSSLVFTNLRQRRTNLTVSQYNICLNHLAAKGHGDKRSLHDLTEAALFVDALGGQDLHAKARTAAPVDGAAGNGVEIAHEQRP
jgi:hypothetical protein